MSKCHMLLATPHKSQPTETDYEESEGIGQQES